MVQPSLPTLSRWKFSPSGFFSSRAVRSIAFLMLASVMGGSMAGCYEPKPFEHTPVGVLPMGSIESSWFVDLSLADDPVVSIDVRDRLVYVYTTSKRVIAFDRKAGTLQMSMHVKSYNRFLLPVVELRDRIVFPNATSLEVFDYSGVFDKSVSLDKPLRSNAAGEGNNIFFGSVNINGGLVESYNVDRPLAPFNWEYMTYDRGNVTAGICTYNNILYSGSENGEVDAVSTSRVQIWDTPHGAFYAHGLITADLKVDDYGLYISSQDSNLYCVNRQIGKLKWQYFAGTGLTDAPVPTADMVYQFVPGKGLAAIDKIAGAFNRLPRWIHPTATQFLAEDEKYAYLADPRPSPRGSSRPSFAIIAVDKMTMKTAFESKHQDFNCFGTNNKDSLIYAGFEDGKLFALNPVIKGGRIGELVMADVSAKANAEVRMQNAE